MEYHTTDGQGNEERHLVVYIDSHPNKPHDVKTVKWNQETNSWGEYMDHWDFEKDGKSDTLIFHQSGGGGSCRQLSAPHYVDGTTGCTIWLHPMASFEEGAIPVNCTLVLDPPVYSSSFGDSRNPFDHGWEQCSIDYCAECEAHYGDEGCPDHQQYCEECSAFYGDEGCPDHGLQNDEEE